MKPAIILGVIILSCLTTGYAQPNSAGDEFYLLPVQKNQGAQPAALEILNLQTGVVTNQPLSEAQQQMRAGLIWLGGNEGLFVGPGKMARLAVAVWSGPVQVSTDLKIEAVETRLALSPDRSHFALIYEPYVPKPIEMTVRVTRGIYIQWPADQPHAALRLYQRNPLRLISELKGDYDIGFISLDDQGRIFFRDYYGSEALVWSATTTNKKLSRAKIDGDWLDLQAGKVLSVETAADFNDYRVTDILSKKTQVFRLPAAGVVGLSEDGNWLLCRFYEKKRNSDTCPFNGRVILVNLVSEQQTKLNLDPKILSSGFSGKAEFYNYGVLNENMITRKNRFYFINPQNLTELDPASGAVVTRPLVR